jgi:long-chain acyl-CoA synthetase
MAMMKYQQNSIFNRLRFIFDDTLRMSNITDAAAAAYGSRDAFKTDGSLRYLGHQGHTLSYVDVHEVVSRLATLLLRAGLSRYGRVAIYKKNSIDYFLMSLAVMRAGGIAVPVHGGLNPKDFTAYAEYCGCEIIYSDTENFARLSAAAFPMVHRWIFAEAAENMPENSIVLERDLNSAVPMANAAPINVHDDALIVHTSGTTGFPKGVLHSSHSLIRACRAQLILNPVPVGERAMSAAHQNHHISFTGMQLSLLAGAWSFAATNLQPRHLLETMQRERTNIFFAFPDIYLNMYREGMERYDLSAMKLWFSGGDAMHEVHIRACTNLGRGRVLGIPMKGSFFVEFLGTSEVGSAALTKISTRKTSLYGRCVGRPTWVGPKVKVADECGRSLPRGEVGRLMVKGPTLFKGYWNLHEKLHGTVIDGWWWTGDMAKQDSRGRFYQIDREVDVVPTNAGAVYGLPIEEELLKCPDVAEAVVVGLAHPSGGLVPVAIAHSLSGRPLDTVGILKEINRRMPAESGLVDVIDAANADGIPRGLTGKVLKRRLREHYADWFTPNQASLVA